VSEGFGRLHPAVQHHVVNSLGWRTLRPLQEQSILPIVTGEDVLLGAPTAGGKTEAAVLPLLSRMVDEHWSGLSVLYVCPLRALLNNLHPRITGYAELLGRTAGLWHGDVGPGERKRVLREPPDLLLTTPESLEAMFLSRTVDAARLLGGVRAIVVDEIHAFAGDDRGWHLLAMLERVQALCLTPQQRVGLTATVGNPEELLEWLSRRPTDERRTVVVSGDGPDAPELEVDWVASMPNAATVIAGLHRGEKRLVFCDSRARVEELASALRAREITTFVSHSSLSRAERHLAETAFAEATDCVIVATSTLELGIDVGDLDRVIQIDAPATVASVLQRSGRTGRRPGTRRNCLFLCLTDDTVLQALALCRLIAEGWVEPVVGPPLPLHLAAQQLLAQTLHGGRLGDSSWPGPLAPVAALAGLESAELDAVKAEMEQTGVLLRDGAFVQIGREGEERYGKRHFMEVTSLFLTEPLLLARWGARELGHIDPSALSSKDDRQPTILLGGRAWTLEDVDWRRRIAWVVPSDDPGRSRWRGAGVALSAEICRSMRTVLVEGADAGHLSARAQTRLAQLQEEFAGVRPDRTLFERGGSDDRERWWTFAGGRANATLAAGLEREGIHTFGLDDLSIGIRGPVGYERFGAACEAMAADLPVADPDPRALEGLKFSECLPHAMGLAVLGARMADAPGVRSTLAEGTVMVASDDLQR
jgi:ATP-dependent Lhr-like helicase